MEAIKFKRGPELDGTKIEPHGDHVELAVSRGLS